MHTHTNALASQRIALNEAEINTEDDDSPRSTQTQAKCLLCDGIDRRPISVKRFMAQHAIRSTRCGHVIGTQREAAMAYSAHAHLPSECVFKTQRCGDLVDAKVGGLNSYAMDAMGQPLGTMCRIWMPWRECASMCVCECKMNDESDAHENPMIN